MKTKLRSLFNVLAWIAGVHSVSAQPAMSLTPAGNLSVIAWPSAVTNYVLQTTTNLATPDWVTVSNAVPVIVNDNVTVIITNTALATFFRLYNTNSTAIPAGMALIPAGSFTIGNSIGDSDITVYKYANPTNVYVSAFYMDVNLVSSNQWRTVYSYATNHGISFVYNVGAAKAANHPVQEVDWYDVVKWCNARSLQAGLTPVYYTDAGLTQVYTNGETDAVYPNWTASGYRLPTEAEWEKAARGGLSGQRFPWGDTISESQANYYGCTTCSYNNGYDLGPSGYNPSWMTGGPLYTSPVGSFAANGYGLNDMAGNVEEWCWDWWDPNQPTPAGSPYAGGIDPRGPASSPRGYRVLRGGDWNYNATGARCASRDGQLPGLRQQHLGLPVREGVLVFALFPFNPFHPRSVESRFIELDCLHQSTCLLGG